MCWSIVWLILHTGSWLFNPVQCDFSNLINTVVVNCTNQGPAIHVTWARRTSFFSRKREETSTPASCCSIKIRNASLQTSYLCLADQMDTTDLLLQVQYSPLLPQWKKNYYEVVTCQGYEVELTCDVYRTTKRDQNLRKRRRDTTLFSGEFMVIANLRRNHTCNANHETGKRNITFVVEYPPVIFVPAYEIMGARESEAILQCLVEGFPPPSVTWYKDGEMVASGQSYLYESFVEPGQNCTLWAMLRIVTVSSNNTNSTEDGFGNYTCLAENKHGRTSAMVRFVELRNETAAQEEVRRFNVTGFIVGMMPPMLISFYIIIRLGYRSRYAEERADEDGLREERFFVSY